MKYKSMSGPTMLKCKSNIVCLKMSLESVFLLGTAIVNDQV